MSHGGAVKEWGGTDQVQGASQLSEGGKPSSQETGGWAQGPTAQTGRVGVVSCFLKHNVSANVWQKKYCNRSIYYHIVMNRWIQRKYGVPQKTILKLFRKKMK